ncbi:hypothetical protein SSX86_005642 [Deinandra increscens subsp. villosa]|uniref:F-box domain-containing protein n=1 Tax=Deinandra increscens subsp. villosa TaxID=3103831 RepID=A0AAP0DLL6_9ASTR
MSDNLPFELQSEIIKRLPVIPLIRFRSVSKAWKSLIDSSDFTADYSGKVQHLLVNYYHYTRNDHKYVLIVDDHTFPQHKVSPTPPELVTMLKCCRLIGSSHGLLCLYGYYRDSQFPETEMSVLWNIQIRKAVAVVLPNPRGHLGFGVCSYTNDPKIVNIRPYSRWRDSESITCIPWQVEIFNLSTGAWRSLYNNLPRKSVDLFRSQVVIDGFLYWLATDKIAIDGGLRSCNLIVSFDITSEAFGEVNLPDTLAHDRSRSNLYISKLRKSLVVIESDGVEKTPTFIVWMMGDGNSKSLTKLFSIYTPDVSILGVLEFRESGEPILEISEHDLVYSVYDSSLVVYEPYSKHITNLGIDGKDLVLSVSSYMETLLLHDQPNFVIYDKGKRSILKQRAVKSRRLSKHTSKKLNLCNSR